MSEFASEVDVVVVGAGACGLVAALRAAQHGASVVVLEKLDRLAGNTTLSSGSIPGAGSRYQRAAGIEDSPQRMADDLRRIAGPQDTEELVNVLSERSAEVVEWLADYAGVSIRLITFYKHVGHSVARLHGPPTGRGSDLLADLARRATALEIPVLFSNPVRRLISDDKGAIIGVEVGGERVEPYRVRAKAVILATNGYGANRSMLREYCPDIAAADYFGARGSEGEAVEWGRQLGAQLGNTAAYQAHASVAYPHGEPLTWSVAEKGGFFVNRAGQRFGNETLGYSGFGAAVMAQGNEAYVIYDARIRDFVAERQEPFRALVDLGVARDAPTIEELAGLRGLDAGGLAEALASFNRAARGEAPDPFGRQDFGLAPLEPPYVITRINAGLFHTQGGLLVDRHARVLRGDGRAVPNLFAGGGAAAGVSGRAGGGGYVSGNGLLAATVLGYIAGETAAQDAAA